MAYKLGRPADLHACVRCDRDWRLVSYRSSGLCCGCHRLSKRDGTIDGYRAAFSGLGRHQRAARQLVNHVGLALAAAMLGVLAEDVRAWVAGHCAPPPGLRPVVAAMGECW